MKQYNLFDLDIANANQFEISDYLGSVVPRKSFFRVLTLNSLMISSSLNDSNLKEWMKSSHLITADGQGIILGMKLLNNSTVQTCTGIDLVYLLLQKSYRFYFVGSTQDNIKLAVDKVHKQFPNADICGYSHGYLSSDEEAAVINHINLVKPDFILVGMGFPKQEYFIKRCSLECEQGVAVGIGGVFDVLSGAKKMAPSWIRFIKMEWFFRAIQDPRKFLSFGKLFAYLFYIVRLYCKRSLVKLKLLKNS